MMSVVLVILAAVAIFQGADAQCYNCTLVVVGGQSVGPAGCGEPFDSTGIPISPCADKCKTSTTNSAADGAQPAIVGTIRTCHNPAAQGGVPCIDFDNFEVVPGTTVSQTCCTGALCNGGPGGQPGDMSTSEPGDMPTFEPGDMPTGEPGDMPTGLPAAEPTVESTDVSSSPTSSATFLTFTAALAVFAPLSALIF